MMLYGQGHKTCNGCCLFLVSGLDYHVHGTYGSEEIWLRIRRLIVPKVCNSMACKVFPHYLIPLKFHTSLNSCRKIYHFLLALRNTTYHFINVIFWKDFQVLESMHLFLFSPSLELKNVCDIALFIVDDTDDRTKASLLSVPNTYLNLPLSQLFH